jgi:hypothetical protein
LNILVAFKIGSLSLKRFDDMINGINCVNFLGFKVNNQDHYSMVNFGPIQIIDQFLSYKRNQGVGDPGGDVSPINIPIAWIADPDLTDSNSAKTSLFNQ